MGLYMNEDKDPQVYKNNHELIEPNQHSYRQDVLVVLMKEQQKMNDSLHKSLQTIENTNIKQLKVHARRIANVRYHIEELYGNQDKRHETDTQTLKFMEQLHEKNETLSKKIEQQIELQNELLEKLSKQEVFQAEVIERLKNQEALAEKILRKVEHFRSILYERSNYISEKIGKGYEATSTYIAKLIKIDQLPNVEENKKERDKSID